MESTKDDDESLIMSLCAREWRWHREGGEYQVPVTMHPSHTSQSFDLLDYTCSPRDGWWPRKDAINKNLIQASHHKFSSQVSAAKMMKGRGGFLARWTLRIASFESSVFSVFSHSYKMMMMMMIPQRGLQDSLRLVRMWRRVRMESTLYHIPEPLVVSLTLSQSFQDSLFQVYHRYLWNMAVSGNKSPSSRWYHYHGGGDTRRICGYTQR